MEQKSYFGVKKSEKFYLDESKEQWIEYKKLPEGERAAYEDDTDAKLFVDQETRQAHMETKVGTDRRKLVMACVIGYRVLVGENLEEKSTYSKEEWELLFSQMDSDKAEELHEAIILFNGFKKKSVKTEK